MIGEEAMTELVELSDAGLETALDFLEQQNMLQSQKHSECSTPAAASEGHHGLASENLADIDSVGLPERRDSTSFLGNGAVGQIQPKNTVLKIGTTPARQHCDRRDSPIQAQLHRHTQKAIVSADIAAQQAPFLTSKREAMQPTPSVSCREVQLAKQREYAAWLARPKTSCRKVPAAADAATEEAGSNCATSHITDIEASDQYNKRSIFSGGGVRHEWSIWDEVVANRQLRKRVHVKPSVLSGGLPAPARNRPGRPSDPWPPWPPTLRGEKKIEEDKGSKDNSRQCTGSDEPFVLAGSLPTTADNEHQVSAPISPRKDKTDLSPKMKRVATVYGHNSLRRHISPIGRNSRNLRIDMDSELDSDGVEELMGAGIKRQRIISSYNDYIAKALQRQMEQKNNQHHRCVRSGMRSPTYVDMVVRQQVYGAEWPPPQQPQQQQFGQSVMLREPQTPIASLRGVFSDAESPSSLLSLSAQTVSRLAKLHPAGGDVLINALLAQMQEQTQIPEQKRNTVRRSEVAQGHCSSKPTGSPRRPGTPRSLRTPVGALRGQPVAINAKPPLVVGRWSPT
jgi:hypothetical protein